MEESSQIVRIEVKDFGPGISKVRNALYVIILTFYFLNAFIIAGKSKEAISRNNTGDILSVLNK